MSASAPASCPPALRGRARQRDASSIGTLAGVAAMLLLIGAAGCNDPLDFNTPALNGTGGAGGTGVGPVDSGGAAGDTGLGGSGAGGSGTGGQITGTGGDIVPPPDAGRDVPVDNGPGDAGPPDAPLAQDVRPDVPPDRPPDTVDANNPVVCTTDPQCRFPTLALHCFIAGGQTSGSCVECTGDSDCTTTGLRRCDTMAGSTTYHRCVECMNGTVNTDCPSLSTEHLSTCNNEHHCLQGCSDDTTQQLMCNKPGFVCQSSGGSEPDHQCADCLAQADCTAPLRCINFVCLQCTLNTDCATGQFCDNVAGRCVACRDSADCRVAGLRLCSPATHTCVASN